MMITLIGIDAALVCIVAGLLVELYLVRQKLEEQKIICANLKTWQPKWKQPVPPAAVKPAESPAELLDQAWESVRGGKEWADMAAVGYWLHCHGFGQPYRRYGFTRLAEWVESLDEWQVIREPEQYGGAPVVLLKR